MSNFAAICYHGSKDILCKNSINFNYKQYKEHFLGRGFYVFRDSYSRALEWVQNRHKNNKKDYIYKVKIEVDNAKLLNFTSTNWGKELDVLELFLEICERYNIHFGIFLDILIDKFDIEIDAIAIIDLRDENYFVPVVVFKDNGDVNHKTLFAFGDIQICIKTVDIIKEFVKC